MLEIIELIEVPLAVSGVGMAAGAALVAFALGRGSTRRMLFAGLATLAVSATAFVMCIGRLSTMLAG